MLLRRHYQAGEIDEHADKRRKDSTEEQDLRTGSHADIADAVFADTAIWPGGVDDDDQKRR